MIYQPLLFIGKNLDLSKIETNYSDTFRVFRI